MNIAKFPLTKITPFFVLGILCAYYLNPNLYVSISFFVLNILLLLYFYVQNKKEIVQKPYFSYTIFFLFFWIGINTTLIHNESIREEHYTKFTTNYSTIQDVYVILDEKLKTTPKYTRYIAQVTHIGTRKTNGKILLAIQKDSVINNLTIGTKLKVRGELVANFKPNNPNQFDYGKYLENKGIFAQVFTVKNAIHFDPNPIKNVNYYTSYFRNKITQNLEKKGFKKEELAVVSALILGQQQDISPEVLQDYQYAGAVHILSVSGLHVGFILVFLTFILNFLPKNKFSNWIKLLVVLLGLWLFALVAGLAPSVVRSTVMFSFVAIGIFLKRETYIMHTLLVSMFLILLFKPLFLFDIGFQLSYLALFFILWLQPMLEALWIPKNKISGYFWDILTVSFAAQIGAMPLSIYYFHQFPGLFFVTNLVLIPFLSIIMVVGVLVLLLAFFNIIPFFLMYILQQSIAIMNAFIKYIASIEAFVISNIPLSFSLLIASYGVLFTWVFWIKKPSFYKAILALVSILLFQILYISSQWSEQRKQDLIVFNIKNNTVIGERLGKNITLYSLKDIPKNSFEEKTLQNYATANFCTITSTKPLQNVLLFGDKKILIIDSSSITIPRENPDIVLLIESPKINLDRLIAQWRPRQIIAGSTNYKSYIKRWEQTCKHKNIPFHSIYEKGYYKISD
jgi:competence protein ComEC